MTPQKKIYTGICFAILACIIWSGNFIVARAVINDVPPVTLAFFRWSIATIILIPFAIKPFLKERSIIIENKRYFLWTSLFGVAIFNTFLYIAAHTTSAINMALIGTCSSPIFAVFLAAWFLKRANIPMENYWNVGDASWYHLPAVRGSFERLLNFHFTAGDLWVLGAAVFFAGYNVLVRKKPSVISPIVFLFTTFLIGSMLLFPFYFWEAKNNPPIEWTTNLFLIVLYLGLGTSVIAFLLWNSAIAKLGAARTALFGNLIPLFSSLEAVWLLNEDITIIHMISGLLIIVGLIIVNLKTARANGS